MENVRIVPNAPEEQDTDLADEGPATATADGEDASVLGDNTALPLHEEVTALARAFESRVNFEKVRKAPECDRTVSDNRLNRSLFLNVWS